VSTPPPGTPHRINGVVLGGVPYSTEKPRRADEGLPSSAERVRHSVPVTLKKSPAGEGGTLVPERGTLNLSVRSVDSCPG
jgi:hypothetical protein